MVSQGESGWLTEKCGVIAVVGVPDAVALSLLGLHGLQHRGHEAFGVAFVHNGGVSVVHRFGRVMSVNPGDLSTPPAETVIGHVRYSTSGGSDFSQPVYLKCQSYEIVVAHNGNLTNADEIRTKLESEGCVLQSEVDTEVIAHLIARSSAKTPTEKIVDALQQVEGAYSLLLFVGGEIFAVRDPYGIRPLSLGKLGDGVVIASETCALDMLKATFVRDIAPGELLRIKDGKLISLFPFSEMERKFCIFEHVYFSRPDSILEGRSVYASRKEIGKELARESKIDADMVVPVLDSGMVAALGYSEESRLPLELAITRNHYSSRSFIEPTPERRSMKVKLKHNANRFLLKGKKVVLVDDSIVRGTTLKQLIAMLWEAGTSEIHVRISSPRILNPCYYGVDTPNKKDLISANIPLGEMSVYLGATSLYFLTLEGLYRAVSGSEKRIDFCDACFTGDYPIKCLGTPQNK
ncbi:amidophosphoribosyltransferase [Neorickettsia risticii]|uniref:Amidophosphoribosyltransferase n=1 Tax=Neorickettsia risticii (strain Illinois) TaxID=434131 RepID=C6V463_NEORI|nr:amidophosphoribosyltransferase [Neorickettsia risticii]ACT69187.1 amidophosphoribosyltransferase [Neorickettsia risticii str. Illinois]